MPDLLSRLSGYAAVLLAAQASGIAQSAVPRAEALRPPPLAPAGPPSERMEVVDPDKKLSAGDQVTVEIVEDREGGFARVVTATGELDVPPLGRVKVAGQTTLEAGRLIKRRLEDDYYHHATVRLSIDRVSPVAVKSGSVSVAGEVRQVGEQSLISGETLTLSAAILKAGGWGSYANPKKVQLSRTINGSPILKTYNVKDIIERGDAKMDPVLQDGDRIFVPRSVFNL